MSDGNDAAHPLSAPAKVTGLLEYQDGSVVSRTLVKKKTGTLTLFALASRKE